jgi:NO-binding membrane sensor protein with MHYT domain
LGTALSIEFGRWNPLALLSALPGTIVGGYLFGIVPAFITGMMAMGLSDRIPNDPQWLAAATAIGTLSSVVFFVFLSPGLSMPIGLIGAVAAFGSGILALGVRPKAEASTPARS